jgi:hypothetical protein
VVGVGLTDLTGAAFITGLPAGELTAVVTDPQDLHGAGSFTMPVTPTSAPPLEALQSTSVPVDPLPDEADDAGDDPSGDGGGGFGGGGALPEDDEGGEDPDAADGVSADERAAALDGVSDVGGGSTHADGIGWLLAMGIAQGFDDGTFRPLEDVTRGQLATLLVGALGLEPAEPDFSDVSPGAAHAGSIGAVASAGIVEGFEDGTFRPGESVSRQQLASMLARALDLTSRPPPFPDVAANSVHAGSIGAVADEGIVAGYDDGTFRPSRPVSREQVASMLYRALNG